MATAIFVLPHGAVYTADFPQDRVDLLMGALLARFEKAGGDWFQVKDEAGRTCQLWVTRNAEIRLYD